MTPAEFVEIKALVEKAEIERDRTLYPGMIARDQYSVTYNGKEGEQRRAEQDGTLDALAESQARRGTAANRMRKSVEAYRAQGLRKKKKTGRPPLSKEHRLRLGYLADRVFRVRDIIQSKMDGSKHSPLGQSSAYDRALEYVSKESGIGAQTLRRRACDPEPADPHYAEMMDLKARYQAARIAEK